MCFFSPRKLRKISNLTSTFFQWVETANYRYGSCEMTVLSIAFKCNASLFFSQNGKVCLGKSENSLNKKRKLYSKNPDRSLE